MSSSSSSMQRQARADWLLAGVLVLLTLPVLVLWRRAMHFHTEDLEESFVPWLLQVERAGRFRGLQGGYAEYSPPYFYLLSLFSGFSRWFSPPTVVRLISIAFTALTAALGYSTGRALGLTARRAVLVGWLLLVAPEIFANGVVWGQSDIVSTFFLLLFFRLLLARRPAWAMATLGVALSIKLQAVFMGPTVLALLVLGEIPLWTVLLIPLSYAAMMIPAAMAGRPPRELVWVYGSQYGAFQAISLNAANPWRLLVPWSSRSAHTTGELTEAALLLGFVTTVLLVVFLVRLRPRLAGRHLLAALALSLLVEPFVLPKMHERYYFAGDTMLLVLAMAYPRVWAVPAALLQVAALMAYTPYLLHPEGSAFYAVAVLLVLLALVLLVRSLGLGRGEAADEAEPESAPQPA